MVFDYMLRESVKPHIMAQGPQLSLTGDQLHDNRREKKRKDLWALSVPTIPTLTLLAWNPENISLAAGNVVD